MSHRVGVVGCGRWGANIVRDLVSLGATVHVVDPDEERRRTAGALGVAGTVTRVDELPDCDGFVVATPASRHLSVCEQLLQRSVPVFVEKPPCASVDEASALLTQGDGRVFVMHKWRYHEGVRVLAAMARAGDLGELQVLETVRTGPEPLPADADVLWHLAVHDLSIALEIFGELPPVRAADGVFDAEGRMRACRARLAAHDGVEHRFEVAAGAPVRVRRLSLRGTAATAVLEHADADHLTVTRDQGSERHPIAQEPPLLRELAAFLAYLGGGPPPASNAPDARSIVDRLGAVEAVIASDR